MESLLKAASNVHSCQAGEVGEHRCGALHCPTLYCSVVTSHQHNNKTNKNPVFLAGVAAAATLVNVDVVLVLVLVLVLVWVLGLVLVLVRVRVRVLVLV